MINFATKLDPNGPTLVDWPAYTAETPALLTLMDGNVTQGITEDTYRVEGMQVLVQLMLTKS